MQKKTIISLGFEGRKKFLAGLEKAANIVNSTLGPAGLNTMYESDYNDRVDVADAEYNSEAPTVTNDGVKIGSKVKLDDPIEDLAAQSLFEAQKQQNMEAGDATTTVATMYHSLVKSVFNQLNEGGELGALNVNRMELKKEIEEAKDEIIDILRKKAKPVKTQKELENIAITAGENEVVDKKIAEAWWKVGKDGFVGVVGHRGLETEIEVHEGMRINAKLMSEYMRTNAKGHLDLKDVATVVTNHEIKEPQQIINLQQYIIGKQKFDLIIFAPKFSTRVIEAINTLRVNAEKQNAQFQKTGEKRRVIRIFGIAIPSLTEKEGGQVEDLAIFTGSTFVDSNKSMELEKINQNDIGLASKIYCDNDVAIIGGKENEKARKDRIKELEEEKKEEKDDFFQKKLQNRIGALSSGMATVKVGATTDTERRYIKLKADDTVYACQNALREGYIKGAGQVLKSLPCKNEHLKKTFQAPYNQIMKNAGNNLEIPNWVLDPVLSETLAIERAVSMAGMVITTDNFISYLREGIEDKLDNLSEVLKNIKLK